ncbi:MarR family transcriptional regulator [Pusillimonas sp. T2]|uniref:MarR family winged helix-turn-helix transcriptional regulator n=1 Tax=Pusillimonas sp. T2 TaxID=1548123 RepID=UPI000B9D0472|nr:MarR family transcriptional regulator [Pusillimonas sp. T2]OXR47964.1 MarR family transcriptional regulator [Pusillimonas sp. T2]
MLEKLYGRPGFLLRRAHQISVALFEHSCKELSLTPAQFGVLYVVNRVSPIDQATLSRCLGFDKVTTLHVVRVLENRGLLSRSQSIKDARKLDIELTSDGQAIFEKAMPLAVQAATQLLKPLTPDQQEVFLELLGVICSDLEGFARAPLDRRVMS